LETFQPLTHDDIQPNTHIHHAQRCAKTLKYRPRKTDYTRVPRLRQQRDRTYRAISPFVSVPEAPFRNRKSTRYPFPISPPHSHPHIYIPQRPSPPPRAQVSSPSSTAAAPSPAGYPPPKKSLSPPCAPDPLLHPWRPRSKA
jgi:hypothetical protein